MIDQQTAAAGVTQAIQDTQVAADAVSSVSAEIDGLMARAQQADAANNKTAIPAMVEEAKALKAKLVAAHAGYTKQNYIAQLVAGVNVLAQKGDTAGAGVLGDAIKALGSKAFKVRMPPGQGSAGNGGVVGPARPSAPSATSMRDSVLSHAKSARVLAVTATTNSAPLATMPVAVNRSPVVAQLEANRPTNTGIAPPSLSRLQGGTQLAGIFDAIGDAMKAVGGAFGDVAGYVKDNIGAIGGVVGAVVGGVTSSPALGAAIATGSAVINTAVNKPQAPATPPVTAAQQAAQQAAAASGASYGGALQFPIVGQVPVTSWFAANKWLLLGGGAFVTLAGGAALIMHSESTHSAPTPAPAAS